VIVGTPWEKEFFPESKGDAPQSNW